MKTVFNYSFILKKKKKKGPKGINQNCGKVEGLVNNKIWEWEDNSRVYMT